MSEEDRLRLFPINCKETRAGGELHSRWRILPLIIEIIEQNAPCDQQILVVSMISADVMPANALEIARRVEAHAQGARGALADQTRRALASDSRIWSAWCAERNISALPAEPTAVVAFVVPQCP